ncbi:thioesterase [Mycolicibacterium litorale]|nr:thioesterase [Mycolicibacterium litorale]
MTEHSEDSEHVGIDRGHAIFAPLTQSVRRLIDATIRTDVDDHAVETARALVDQATGILAEQQIAGPFGVRQASDGGTVAWGNVAIGLRNPVAPPLVIHHRADGSVCTDIDLGAAYEGPPGHVHGGISALILDHVLAATAHQPDKPAFTGTLTIRYRRPTRLGPVHAEARIDRSDGAKTFAVGHLSDSDGVTVDAHGVFIRPKGPDPDEQ